MARDLVVVGASAGGVEALRALVRTLPNDLNAAVLVVLHIPLGAPSALSQILSRSGPLSAFTAQDGDRLTLGRIYVAPSGRHMVVQGSRIVLSHGPAENGHRPAIDPLFRSAAQHFGPRVIGVILSGSRDDGTAGLAAIVERGGIPVVQDPDTALHRSMPCSAMQHLTIEHVLSPAKIGRLLAELVRQGTKGAEPSADEPLDTEPSDTEPSDTEPSDTELLAAATAVGATDWLGRPTGLSCPSCHGAMFELDGTPSPRYRCRVGHAWSPESLLAAQGEAVDIALWTALRALTEQSALSRQLAVPSDPPGGSPGDPEIVGRHTARAEDTDRAAEQIRRLLTEIRYRD